MRLTIIAATIASLGLLGGASLQANARGGLDKAAQQALDKAVAGPQRSEANRARDAYRHPIETQANANPKDTADWEEGVWTLPPTLALGDKDKAKYMAIGESDRMTLRFVKP